MVFHSLRQSISTVFPESIYQQLSILLADVQMSPHMKPRRDRAVRKDVAISQLHMPLRDRRHGRVSLRFVIAKSGPR